MIKYLTEEEYVKNSEINKYWFDNQRWYYMSKVIDILKMINPTNILEMGTEGIQLSDVSDTIELSSKFNPTYNHNALDIPWHIADKQYDVFVALQVFEHIDIDINREKQILAFNEAKRISKNIILSLPHNWKNHDAWHDNINEGVVIKWSSFVMPNESYSIVSRKIYVWLDI